jgi:SAM-dependent methyltransferase
MSAPSLDKAAERGVPSLVWRAGQARRLGMIRAAAPPLADGTAYVLENGCGVGVYIEKLQHALRTPFVFGLEYDSGYAAQAGQRAPAHVVCAASERLPYADESFDVVVSNEVIEHVRDDRAALAEMVRVLRSPDPASGRAGGRIVLFCPNRWYPVETHGIYWRGCYTFGNIPLVNYLPDPLRNRLAPHVRAYTRRGLRKLFEGLPVRIVAHTRIFGGYDNLIARLGWPGKLIRGVLHSAEKTPLSVLGLSHFVVAEKTQPVRPQA